MLVTTHTVTNNLLVMAWKRPLKIRLSYIYEFAKLRTRKTNYHTHDEMDVL